MCPVGHMRFSPVALVECRPCSCPEDQCAVSRLVVQQVGQRDSHPIVCPLSCIFRLVSSIVCELMARGTELLRVISVLMKELRRLMGNIGNIESSANAGMDRLIVTIGVTVGAIAMAWGRLRNAQS